MGVYDSNPAMYDLWRRCEEVVKTALRGCCALGVAAAAAISHAGQLGTEWRVGYMECGRTQVRALAECYETTPHCVSETLSFSRTERRVRVGLHGHYEERAIGKLPVQVLDYRAASWTCVSAQSGGHYLLVSLARTTAGACAACEYERLYEVSGRLVATTVTFDSRGEPRPNEGGRVTIARLVPAPARRDAIPVYR